MSARVYESMVRLKVGSWTIRVWRTEDKIGVWDNIDLVVWAKSTNCELQDAPLGSDQEAQVHKIFAELEKFPRMAAIEILAESGNGFLLYPSWP